MKRIAWTTDLHLDFLEGAPAPVDGAPFRAFCAKLIAAKPDAVLIGGDIAVAAMIEAALSALARVLQRPIYFVLGNHDFYKGSIAGVRSVAARISEANPRLCWLSRAGVIELTPTTALVGDDGWADGRLGNGVRSEVLLNDYFMIQELTGLDRTTLFAQLNALGDEAAEALRPKLLAAVTCYAQVILLTHVPPFKESCWYQGQISNAEFLPHFTCKAMGDLLVEVMREHPECRLTVLCGHTHGSGQATVLPNLLVKTGGAEYGQPELQELIVVE